MPPPGKAASEDPASRFNPPLKITLLCFDYALAAAVTGMHDLLYFAGNHYSRQRGLMAPDLAPGKRFKLRLASAQGRAIKLSNRLSLNVHCGFDEIRDSDVLLVPAMAGDPERTLAANPQLLDFLRQTDTSQCLLGSNSNGAFFLAEAGLLTDKQITTFWGNADLFNQRYPHVHLRPQERLVRDGNIISDSGGSSWFDLGLYLVEHFCDHTSAAAAAKYFMVDMARSAQLSFAPEFGEQQHNDKTILALQDWLAQHYADAIVLSEVAAKFGLSSRSLVRRFKLATGLSPVQYLQELRLDAASRLLVQTRRSIEDITHAVGYRDVSSFIRLFKRRTHYSPSSYRARYQTA